MLSKIFMDIIKDIYFNINYNLLYNWYKNQLYFSNINMVKYMEYKHFTRLFVKEGNLLHKKEHKYYYFSNNNYLYKFNNFFQK
jgi:hypothetical protein